MTTVSGFARVSSTIDNDVRRNMVRAHGFCPTASACHACMCHPLTRAMWCTMWSCISRTQDVAFLQTVLKPINDRLEEMEELEVCALSECQRVPRRSVMTTPCLCTWLGRSGA
jgi:hypothetical protein